MYALIMAGGHGTRFWPLSREMTPKQMLKIAGSNTMIQDTVERILPLVPPNHLYIATSEKHTAEIEAQLKEISKIKSNINFIAEPMGKNTAPAIAVAATYINEIDPESIMVVLPSDHVIQKKTEFLELLKQAEKLAARGCLVTFGIKPIRPETGYGYIKAGKKFFEGFKVDKFTEKPDLKTAQKYLTHPKYFWNGGIFVWQTKTILQEIRKYLPSLYEKLNLLKSASNQEKALKNFYLEVASISIDYGIMEHTNKAVVIPADINWNDVGSWAALDEVIEKDANGNIVAGNVIDINSQNSIIYGGKELVATIGLNNMVVVSTDDAILICPKNKSQEVKNVVDKIKEKGSEEYLIHKTVYRPWGYYTVLEKENNYIVRRISIMPKAKIKLQLHHHRSEHWIVISGTAKITKGNKVYHVHPNESIYVPRSTKHRIENPGIIPLQIIEVQNGEYLEKDLIRFED